MNQIKNWKALLVITLLLMLLGGYYERLSVEIRTMILPMFIFFIAAFAMVRFKQLEHEVRSFKVMAYEIEVQNLSIVDSDGRERISLNSASDNASMTFYDENHAARVTLELLHQEPKLRLVGDKGSALITFEEEGRPNFALKDDIDMTLWSAP
jgi:hypothetical protein